MAHYKEHLQNIFTNYFIYLKSTEKSLGYEEIYTALFSSLRGLDDQYSSYDFIENTAKDFELIAKHLHEVASRLYLEKEGKQAVHSRENLEKTYTVKEVAAILKKTPEAVRDDIAKKKLKAHKKGERAYEIYASDLELVKKKLTKKVAIKISA